METTPLHPEVSSSLEQRDADEPPHFCRVAGAKQAGLQPRLTQSHRESRSTIFETTMILGSLT